MPSCRVQRILIKKGCSYNRMLEKCVEQVYGKKNPTPSTTYYLADGSGVHVAGESTEYLTTDDGTSEKKIPWTLETYLKVNGKTATKARFYCVEVQGHICMMSIVTKLIAYSYALDSTKREAKGKSRISQQGVLRICSEYV